MCGAINVVTTSCNITTNVEKNNTFHKLKFLSNKNARVISILPYLFYVEKNSIKIVTNLKKQGFSNNKAIFLDRDGKTGTAMEQGMMAHNK